MKRIFFIPFVSALVGGAVVVAVSPPPAGSAKPRRRRHDRRTVSAGGAVERLAGEQGADAARIYVRDAPGVAFVTSTVVQKSESSPFNLFGGQSQRQGTATGSGIVIDANGTILTNYHVVESAVKVTVSFENGKSVEAQVVGKDPSNDLALLRIPTDGLTLHPLHARRLERRRRSATRCSRSATRSASNARSRPA